MACVSVSPYSERVVISNEPHGLGGARFSSERDVEQRHVRVNETANHAQPLKPIDGTLEITRKEMLISKSFKSWLGE